MRNNSDDQFDPINGYDKQFGAISDSEKLVDTGSNPKSDPKSDPNSDPQLSTYTTNANFTQNLLISRFVLKIIPVAIGPINQLVTKYFGGNSIYLGSR